MRFRAEGVAVRLIRFGKLQFCLLHITAFSKRKDSGQDLKARLLRSSIYFLIIQKDLNRNKRTNTFRIAPKKQSSHIRLLQSLPYELFGCTRFAKPRQKIERLAFFCDFTNILYHFVKKSASDLIKTIYFVITQFIKFPYILSYIIRSASSTDS